MLFDAIVVRMTIVPAVMALLGKTAWWLPRRLDRILPNVDIEGEKLRHVLDTEAAVPAREHAVLNRCAMTFTDRV